jgi:3-oxoacyl-[acyl-carrier protein] reductase
VRRALITGASGTLGAAITGELARAGVHVIVHAHSNAAQAEAIREQVRASGGSAEVAIFDVSSSEDCARQMDLLLKAGPVQVLVHNAGITADAPMAGMSIRQWSTVIDVSLNGFFNVTKPVLLPMLRTRWGRIVAISSVAALIGNRGQANYAAAKAGLHGAVKSLAIEVASRGVTVNAVAPGIIESPMTKSAFSAADITRLVPMQRAGTPQEVASVVRFLCSEHASYISGQIVAVNGGMA